MSRLSVQVCLRSNPVEELMGGQYTVTRLPLGFKAGWPEVEHGIKMAVEVVSRETYLKGDSHRVREWGTEHVGGEAFKTRKALLVSILCQ